jgi:hypothetical protein
MAAEYKQLNDPVTGGLSETILRVEDQAHIPPDPANSDYQRYLAWLAQGNTPDPPDVQASSQETPDGTDN